MIHTYTEIFYICLKELRKKKQHIYTTKKKEKKMFLFQQKYE